MAVNKAAIRKAHRVIAPVMILPILLTVTTGSLYQIALLTGKAGDFYWLIEAHKGTWGPVNLQVIYPFLNALGLLVMAATGISMWMPTRRSRKPDPRPQAESD
ncbi:MAG: PepSY domain-containing protein [Cyanobacteriota bacterium]|nr:PepSY domain-containing protein [Cyanobacteriota bacterium]